jgi:hypothetical protein
MPRKARPLASTSCPRRWPSGGPAAACTSTRRSSRSGPSPARPAAEFRREVAALFARHARSEGGAGAWRPSRPLELVDPLLPENDLLEGPCGIGAVERIVRGLQLRCGAFEQVSLGAAIERVCEEELEGEVRPERLALAHRWLTRAELGLGMLGAVSAVLPSDAEGQTALARTMGYAEPDARRALARFLYDWRAVRDEIQEASLLARREKKNLTRG